VYDPGGGVPHLRVENRVLPAGPTVVDVLANAAFVAGLVRVLAEDEQPVWTRMDFRTAEANFHSGARHGIRAEVIWPGVGEVGVTDLVLRKLLPLAYDGLRRWRVPDGEADRLLGIVERRCLSHVNGATWQTAAVARRSNGGDRGTALHRMLADYRDLMATGDPVHSWPLG
jgi:hypothetical protein